jgi:hypothetical protein
MDDIDKLIEELTLNRKVSRFRALVIEWFENCVIGFEKLRADQEEILNIILSTDNNIIIITSRQMGLSKLSEAMFYANHKLEKSSTLCVGGNIPSIATQTGDIIIDQVRFDFIAEDLDALRYYNRVIIFTLPINNFLKSVVDGVSNIENEVTTDIYYYPRNNIEMKRCVI